MHARLDLVHFRKFYGMEERIFHLLPFERDRDVADEVGDRRIFEQRFALSALFGNFDRAVHEFFDPRALQSGYGDDGQPRLLFERFRVDAVAVLFHGVHHVERDDHGHVDFHELRRQIEVTLEVGRVDDVDDAIGLFVEDIIARNNFFGRVRRKGINAGQVDDIDFFLAPFIGPLALIDGYARPVADVRRRTRQKVKKRRFTAVGIARQRKFFHFSASMVTHAASLLRSVSS